MAIHGLAGKPVPTELLVDVPRLVSAYYTEHPDVSVEEQMVSFGTSGHRGSSYEATFNEDHIMAISQAISDYRREHGINGSLSLGMDTHALSEPAYKTAIEVLKANDVDVVIESDGEYTPTPVISHSILTYNSGSRSYLSDGIVITPSHNPPEDGGLKYNPPHGGPADTDVTGWIAERANEYLKNGNKDVKRIPYESVIDVITQTDMSGGYVEDLADVIDMDAIASSGLRIGADALGGSGARVLQMIAEEYGLNMDVLNGEPDPRFSFMRVDHDGRVRMDCSSPFAMAGLIGLKDRYDIAFGNDPDFDRHGIVTSDGLMNPNHYLAVAIDYLLRERKEWGENLAVGKTLVSSSMIDRVAQGLGREVYEVPVGFKWFVDGLKEGTLGFGGEESAGATFLRQDGSTWTTDKDGIILGLLAAEIMATTGKSPSEHYRDLVESHGEHYYTREDSDATAAEKEALSKLSPEQVTATELAGETIIDKLTEAPGNNASIGGLKVTTENGWFAARPSGTEDKYKVYGESSKSEEHLAQIVEEAQKVVKDAIK